MIGFHVNCLHDANSIKISLNVDDSFGLVRVSGAGFGSFSFSRNTFVRKSLLQVYEVVKFKLSFLTKWQKSDHVRRHVACYKFIDGDKLAWFIMTLIEDSSKMEEFN